MTLKAMTNAVLALVAITLTSLITGAAKVDGQTLESGQDLNASEIDRSTTIEEERTSSASTKEYETGFAQANGITIAYESFGSKDQETMLLIAGTGSQLTFWPTQLIDGLVQSGYRVITFDNRDVGLSTFTSAGYPDSEGITKALQEGKPAPIPYTLRDMANDTVGLLDAVEIRKAHIVGVSMGGNIAQLVAIDHPTRTLSLTLIASDSGNPGLTDFAIPGAFAEVGAPPPEGDVDGFVEYQVNISKALGSAGYPTDEKTLPESWVRDVQRSYEPAGLTRQATVSLIGSLEGDFRHFNLKNIKVPTVVLQGTDDPLIPVESAQDLAANIQGADLFIIPGLGHDMPKQLVPSFVDAIITAATRAAVDPQRQ